MPSRDELIAEIQKVGQIVGRAPKTREMTEHGSYSLDPYYYEFDSFNDALEAAGYASRQEHPNKIPREELLTDLQRVGEEVGRAPYKSDINEYGKYSAATYTKRFGSWNDAVAEAGFDPNPQGRQQQLSTEELIEKLHELDEQLDRTPTQGDMDKHGEHSARTYRLRFGSWTDALQEAGLTCSSR
jgi:hypothetical protein